MTLIELLASDSDFEGLTIEGDCASVIFADKTFYDCEFRNLSLPKACFDRCIFEECRFVGCDLTMATLSGARFCDVQFVGCKLMGIDWSPAAGLTFSVGFEKCVLSHCSFIDLRMKETHFIKCKLHEANFAGTDLTQADFSQSDLEGARFLDTNLTSTDLSTAEHYRIDPEHNIVKQTKFSIPAALALVTRLGIVVE